MVAEFIQKHNRGLFNHLIHLIRKKRVRGLYAGAFLSVYGKRKLRDTMINTVFKAKLSLSR